MSRLQPVLATAAWLALAIFGLFTLLALGAALAVAVVLSPFVLIGFLVGPASNFPLDLVLVPLGLGVLAAVAAVAGGVWAARRAVAGLRGLGPGWARRAAAVATGAALGMAGGAAALSLLGWRVGGAAAAPHRVAALPASDADRRAYNDQWLPSAKAGDGYAQFVVGAALHGGRLGQAVDHDAAQQWWMKAAAQGDPDAELSLLVARRLGSFGQRQEFAIAGPLQAYAERQAGWRRVAAELLLAQTQPLDARGRNADAGAARRHRLHWLEQAARHGSHHAALTLARELEQARAPDNNPAPDLAGALRWALAAGAAQQVARLREQLGPLDVDVPVLDKPSAVPQELERLQRRAELVAPRPEQTAVTLAREDAEVHRTVCLEATGRWPETPPFR